MLPVSTGLWYRTLAGSTVLPHSRAPRTRGFDDDGGWACLGIVFPAAVRHGVSSAPQRPRWALDGLSSSLDLALNRRPWHQEDT